MVLLTRRCAHKSLFQRCREAATVETVCQKHAIPCHAEKCDVKSDGKYCAEHRCTNVGCDKQRLHAGEAFAPYCERHKCSYCYGEVLNPNRLGGKGYCIRHTCRTPGCKSCTLTEYAEFCMRHTCNHPMCFKASTCSVTNNIRTCDNHSHTCVGCWQMNRVDGKTRCLQCHK